MSGSEMDTRSLGGGAQPTFMADGAPPTFQAPPAPPAPPQACADNPAFDIFEWSPKYASCQRYFLDHAQHSGPVQALSAFMNIQLPCQRHPGIYSSSTAPSDFAGRHLSFGAGSSGSSVSGGGGTGLPGHGNAQFRPAPSVSLFPYLRRLVVTGLDFPGVLHGFFGDDWASGVGPLHEQERRNLLFTAKSGGWAVVKREYDISPLETVPFLRPLQGVAETELVAAEKNWSEWLALEDWMVGPRAPTDTNGPAARPGN